VFSTARDRPNDSWDHPGFVAGDTGIGAATGGRVEVLMVDPDAQRLAVNRPARSLRFMFVMDGEVTVTLDDASPIRLGPGDAITIPADIRELVSDPSKDCRLLDVTTPAGG
jgi:quercetin dioxygenase-like cupin family protein